MNNKEIINKKFDDAISGLRNVFEHCCTDDCANCKFSIYNADCTYECTLHHVMDNLAWMKQK